MPNNFPTGCAKGSYRQLASLGHGFQGLTALPPLALLPPGALTWETPTSCLALPRLSALCFLAHGGIRPLPPTRDPNRPRHFRFPSAFFLSVSAAGSEPVSDRAPSQGLWGAGLRTGWWRPALTPSALLVSPGPRGSGVGGVMAELTALESLIEMGFPRGRA